jgi:hypothetical protein
VSDGTDTTTSPSEAPADAGAAVDAGSVETTLLGGDITQEAAPVEAKADDTPEAAEPVPGAPEKYELALEGLTLDPEMLAEAEPILRDLNLTNEQANALLPIAPKLMERASNAMLQQILDQGATQRKDWLDAFAADPDIGGSKREETEHLAAKGLDALGFTKDHPFRKALTETGFGNHPDMIRAFRRMGEMVGEDGDFERGGAGESKSAAPLHERMFPNG